MIAGRLSQDHRIATTHIPNAREQERTAPRDSIVGLLQALRNSNRVAPVESLACGVRLFAQLSFQYFSCAGLGQALVKFNVVGTLVARQAGAADFKQLGLSGD